MKFGALAVLPSSLLPGTLEENGVPNHPSGKMGSHVIDYDIHSQKGPGKPVTLHPIT